MNFTVNKSIKASPIELVDLGTESACVSIAIGALLEITDDDLGQSGRCEGWLSERGRLIKDARNSLLLLKRQIDEEISRSLK